MCSFFYGKDKANERSSQLMVSDHTTLCNTRGATGALPAFKVVINQLFEGILGVSTFKDFCDSTHVGYSTVAWRVEGSSYETAQ